MLEKIQAAPPDPILGLTEAFKNDPNPRKINLGVGVYKDENGLTPVLNSVKQAEERILTAEKSKSYLPIDGAPAYTSAVQGILFGPGHALPASGRVVSAQAPGGTGALRVAADFLAGQMPGATVWVSDPTWPNHQGIFQAAGLKVASYAYFDKQSNGVAFDALLAAVRQIPAGDVIVLHGCCHNPTGVDLAAEQWAQVSTLLAQRQVLPLIDFAYQGFAEGLEEDAVGLRTICQSHDEVLVASSFSKNFGLYNERIGALTLVGANKLLVGTFDDGLFLLDVTGVTPIGLAEGLPWPQVANLQVDQTHVWSSGPRGVYRFGLDELDALLRQGTPMAPEPILKEARDARGG